MIRIEPVKDATRDDDCACCTRSERRARTTTPAYFRVILAPTPDSNRNVVQLCDFCLDDLRREVEDALDDA